MNVLALDALLEGTTTLLGRFVAESGDAFPELAAVVANAREALQGRRTSLALIRTARALDLAADAFRRLERLSAAALETGSDQREPHVQTREG